MNRWTSHLLLLFIAGTAVAQPVAVDTLKNQRILIGHVSQSNMADSLWYRTNYYNSAASRRQLKRINRMSADVSVSLYFGSWCSDSKIWAPAFLGLVNNTDMADRVELIAVSRSKRYTSPDGMRVAVEKVPTFVFSRAGIEIGRIVESPVKSLPVNMLKILRR